MTALRSGLRRLVFLPIRPLLVGWRGDLKTLILSMLGVGSPGSAARSASTAGQRRWRTELVPQGSAGTAAGFSADSRRPLRVRGVDACQPPAPFAVREAAQTRMQSRRGECRFDGKTLPPAAAIQQLVAAWKVLRKT
jgi:hypothetical protein